jgi:hypothetical protein
MPAFSTDDEDHHTNSPYDTTEDEDSDDDSVYSDDSYDSIDKRDIVPMSYKAQRAMEEAVVNIQMCQELFMSWNKELRKYVSMLMRRRAGSIRITFLGL